MKLQVDSNFKQSKMKLQAVINCKQAWNEAKFFFQLQPVNNEDTSCFLAQTSQE